MVHYQETSAPFCTYRLYYLTHSYYRHSRSFLFLQIFYSRICVKLSGKLPPLVFIVSSLLLIRVPCMQCLDSNPTNPNFKIGVKERRNMESIGPSGTGYPLKGEEQNQQSDKKLPIYHKHRHSIAHISLIFITKYPGSTLVVYGCSLVPETSRNWE